MSTVGVGDAWASHDYELTAKALGMMHGFICSQAGKEDEP